MSTRNQGIIRLLSAIDTINALGSRRQFSSPIILPLDPVRSGVGSMAVPSLLRDTQFASSPSLHGRVEVQIEVPHRLVR